MRRKIEEPLPDYVHDVMLAKWAGISLTELETMPYWHVEQYRTVMSAQMAARAMQREMQGGR